MTLVEFQSEKNGRKGDAVKMLYPTDFVKLFRGYLESHNLLIDPVTEKARPLYSLRHTYATIRLLHDKITPQILVKQMGTSLAMLEKHYDHINTIKAASQLRDEYVSGKKILIGVNKFPKAKEKVSRKSISISLSEKGILPVFAEDWLSAQKN